MSWAQLTNRPTANGSQHFQHQHHYHDNHNHNHNNAPHNNHRIRTINNGDSPPRFAAQTQSRTRGSAAKNHTAYQPKVGLTASKKRHHDINYVILDAGAFIGRRSLFNHFDANTRYYMTPGVEQEIRDKHTRNFLENFPYHIYVKQPDPDSIKYVQQFLANNANLTSLSKADRQVIALAHTLETEFGRLPDNHKLPQQQAQKSAARAHGRLTLKAMTVIDDVKCSATGVEDDNHSNSSKSPQIKKSKTGRVHTVVQRQADTGVRLSKLKKVIPFHFDEFLNLSQQEYGDKYGVPMATERELLRASPAIEAAAVAVAVKVKFNPNVKAMTEVHARGSVERDRVIGDGGDDLSNSPLSKAQRRRLRKRQMSEKHAPSNAMMTAENLQLMQAADAASASGSDEHSLDELKLEEITKQSIDEVVSRQRQQQELVHSNHDAESVHSEIDKMIAEDIETTFQENESIITSLTAQSSQQFAAAAAASGGAGGGGAEVSQPSMNHSQSLPTTTTAGGGFGTLFNHQPAGSLFGAMSSEPLPPLAQTDDDDDDDDTRMQDKQKQQKPQKQKSKTKDKGKPQQQQPAQQEKKVNSSDAWNGAWLTPDNFKAEAKNAPKRNKLKLKDVSGNGNAHGAGDSSGVAVITMDLAMQRAMTEMGLRVLSNEAHIQYGQNNTSSSSSQQQQQQQQQEPVEHKFRCYACFTFEHDTTRTHCRVCGGDTYQRVAIYRDEHGKEHYRYSYRDRYAHKYLEKHSLIPRGSQLVKYHQTNGRNVNARTQSLKNQKKKHKRRSYLQQPGGNYRGGWQ